nr:hypothetical protein [Tanacetum cinerariifolium]
MALIFADTHNMIAYLTKSDASEGFDQIIDFLNASSIKYALTVNRNIYVSCIKQFWSSVLVKKVNDVMRLQALVDKKKVMITKATIREALRLDGAESIDYLPNEEIFTELSRMGYDKPFTKLTIYKAFFSPQWKFLIHTILQCMSAKRTSWNVFSSSMASAIICLSTGRKFNFSKYIFDSLVRNVDSSTKFHMYPRFLQLMIRAQVGDLSSHSIKYSSPALTQKVFANIRRVGKGFSGVDKPLFEGMIVTQQVDEVADEGATDVDVDDVPAAAEPGIIVDIDADEDVTLKDVDDVAKEDDELEPVELKEVVKVVTTAKLMVEVVTAASATITVVDTLITAATITTAPSAARRRKGVVIRDPEETATPSLIIHSEPKSKDKGKGIMAELNNNINWDEVIEQVQRKEKEYNAVMRYQALKRKPRTEAQSRKNIMIYLRNMTKEQMEEEDIKALKRASESQAEKAAKKQKLDEEIAELKKHLQIVPNDEDDVYTEATPLAQRKTNHTTRS